MLGNIIDLPFSKQTICNSQSASPDATCQKKTRIRMIFYIGSEIVIVFMEKFALVLRYKKWKFFFPDESFSGTKRAHKCR